MRRESEVRTETPWLASVKTCRRLQGAQIHISRAYYLVLGSQ